MLEGPCRDGRETIRWAKKGLAERVTETLDIMLKHPSQLQNSGPTPFYSPTWWEEWSLEHRDDPFSDHWIFYQNFALETLGSCLWEQFYVLLNDIDTGLKLSCMCLSVPSIYCPSLTVATTTFHWQTPHNNNHLGSVVCHLYSQYVCT